MPIYMIIPRYSHNYAQFCTIWCTGLHRPAKTFLQCETSERQRKWEIIHLLKRAGVTDTVRASSSAKDEAPPSTSGAGECAGAGAGATLVELLPKKSARGKSSAFFWILPCPSENARHQGSRQICNHLFCGSYRCCDCLR